MKPARSKVLKQKIEQLERKIAMEVFLLEDMQMELEEIENAKK